jgi:general secretion pathway protein E
MKFAHYKVPARFLERIPLRFAREHTVVAIGESLETAENKFTLAMANPDQSWIASRIAYKLDSEVAVIAADSIDILELLNRSYHNDAQTVSDVAAEVADNNEGVGEIRLGEDVLELDDKAPAVKLVHAMFLQAVRQRASDIHIEPGEVNLRIRFRIDGVLYDRAVLRSEVRDAVASRIKVMGRMDIAERRLPQDGGVTIRIGERQVDLRIATLPTQYGERVVMRLLDKHTGLLTLEGLGLSETDRKTTDHLLRLSHGIILVTGPTGCGKTTSLYAMLSAMNSSDLNILTLEDPVEYQLPGICQTQVSEKKGLTFARGLRAIVRQDPDIIMVGEIRDLETATVAIQSALTGHLVLSTLHTNDAPSSITRLLDLGVEPFLVASSVNAAIAQRLVRKVCNNCCKSLKFEPAALQRDGWSEAEIACLKELNAEEIAEKGACDVCFQTGFSGRTGIYEFLLMSEPLRDLVTHRAAAGQIREAALKRGMVTLRRDGLRKVANKSTTLSEVQDVTQMDLG